MLVLKYQNLKVWRTKLNRENKILACSSLHSPWVIFIQMNPKDLKLKKIRNCKIFFQLYFSDSFDIILMHCCIKLKDDSIIFFIRHKPSGKKHVLTNNSWWFHRQMWLILFQEYYRPRMLLLLLLLCMTQRCWMKCQISWWTLITIFSLYFKVTTITSLNNLYHQHT